MFFSKKRNNTPEINKQKLPKIFSLAPKQDLWSTNPSDFAEYEKFLCAAFSKPDIRNILIAGKFGIGKSSIIRSFENHWCETKKGKSNKKSLGHFLYISLGDYVDSPNNKNQSSSAGNSGESPQKGSVSLGSTTDDKQISDDKSERNVLERRLLLQIYASFHHADLPASGFKLIQEHDIKTKLVIPLFCAIMTCSILLLVLHAPIGHLVSTIFSDLWGAEEVSDLKSCVHLGLYILVIAFSSLATFVVVKDQIPKFQAKSLTLKADSLEAQYESAACESYLDQHTTELIYCLEQVASKIRYTVVFEDLDRLDLNTCLEIFTRLREINYLVNSRVIQKKKEPLRFVYIANDSTIAQLKNSKFFDYILPIYPRINQKTAEKIFDDNFQEMRRDNGNESDAIGEKCSTLIHDIARYLPDYRLQHTVLNDYSLLFQIYKTSNATETENNILNTADENVETSILALAIYKNCFPGDFARIWEGKSNFFPNYKSSAFDQAAREFLSYLQPFLTPQVLYYIGFKRENIIELWENRIKNDLDGALGNNDSLDGEFWVALKNLCDMTISNLPKEKQLSKDIKGKEMSVGDLVKMIKHMVNNGYKNWDWLFKNEKVPAIIAISTLACITCTNDKGEPKLDESCLNALFELVKFDPEGNQSIFENCKNFEGIGHGRCLSELEVQVLVYGTGKQYSGNCIFYVSEGKATRKKCLRNCLKTS